jgi:hypothetical protein
LVKSREGDPAAVGKGVRPTNHQLQQRLWQNKSVFGHFLCLPARRRRRWRSNVFTQRKRRRRATYSHIAERTEGRKQAHFWPTFSRARAKVFAAEMGRVMVEHSAAQAALNRQPGSFVRRLSLSGGEEEAFIHCSTVLLPLSFIREPRPPN